MKLEICVDCVESALAAKDGGADRIEVCGALAVGGVTPSYGLIEECASLGGIEVMMMIRPHAGGFNYSKDELGAMVRDIQVAKDLGVQGVVFGALRKDGRVNRDVCLRLIEAARPLSVTFHRAFDLTPEPLEALDALLEMGVHRLLTSGQAPRATDGLQLIRELVRRAGTNLSVMAGAGILPQDVATVARATGVREIHASASEDVPAVASNNLGVIQSTRMTTKKSVFAMVRAIHELEIS
jgi:copper homeostasis protein